MKKVLLFFVSAIFGIAVVNAQVTFGAKAGVNLSDITGEMVDSFDGRTSLFFGAVAEIEISEQFSFQPELLFSSQGSDYKEIFDGESFEGTVKVNYLNVPLMAKYYLVEGFSVEAGPQIGFLLSAKDEYGDQEDDIKDSIKSTDFGINFGLGYKLDNGLNFSARYNFGLSDNIDDPDLETSGAEYKNSVIQIGVGYFF
ncbi:porin family protein [uncultured Winogradskyella sp.]|uniref:porin family protein n=1 Tax=uncultured Winogradskyella sp. TaxID=395353 RepID=UPI0026331C73|nr:porin family protein [uncultured Winogradskyella sp.]